MAGRKNILYLFDVDGTLTKSRRPIAEGFKKFLLDEVMSKVHVGLVSGSDYSKLVEQMGGDETVFKMDYVFCENGLVQYRGGKLISSESILSHFGEQKLQKVINFALGYMSKLELPAKRGNFVEFRSSMINLCPVGRSCSQAERDHFSQYDKEHLIRQSFKDALEKEFEGSGLKFAVGGQISVDVFPIGWDKTYCLNHIGSGSYDEIHFFGDRTEPGGNDHELYNDSRTIGYKVTSPEDTREKVEALIKALECVNC